MHRFATAGHALAVVIGVNGGGTGFLYDLAVDGRGIGSGETEGKLTAEVTVAGRVWTHVLRWVTLAPATVGVGVLVMALWRSDTGMILGLLIVVMGLGFFWPAFGREMPGRHWHVRCPHCGRSFDTEALRDASVNPTVQCSHCGVHFHW